MLAVILGAGMLGLAANAKAVQYTVGLGPTIYNQITVSQNGGSSYKSLWAVGELDAVQSGVVNPGYQNPLYSYCTDIGIDLYVGQPYNFEAMTFAAANAGGPTRFPAWADGGIYKAAYLYEQHKDEAHVDATKAAALQLSIWEVLYDSGNYSLGSGTFRAGGNSAVVQTGDAWLAGVQNSTDVGYWLYPTPQNTQGMLMLSVPDAGSTCAILGMAFFAIEGFRRKIKA